jgi:hypothetical protein
MFQLSMAQLNRFTDGASCLPGARSSIAAALPMYYSQRQTALFRVAEIIKILPCLSTWSRRLHSEDVVATVNRDRRAGNEKRRAAEGGGSADIEPVDRFVLPG